MSEKEPKIIEFKKCPNCGQETELTKIGSTCAGVKLLVCRSCFVVFIASETKLDWLQYEIDFAESVAEHNSEVRKAQLTEALKREDEREKRKGGLLRWLKKNRR